MRGIELLHPAVQAKTRELQALCDAKGLKLLITETWRTKEEQDALYAQGRAASGGIVTNCKGSDLQSPHQWGVAFDFCKNIKGQEYSDTVFFKTVGQLAKSIGLFWGGDFKSFVDTPHLEMPEFLPSNSTAALKKQYGTPEAFKMTWMTQNVGDDGNRPVGGSPLTGGSPSAPTTPPDSGASGSLRPTVRLGTRGEDVKYLQIRLNTLQKAGLAVDGDFGAKTDAAVKAFQKAGGLTADGIAGPKTWTALG